MAIDTKPNLSSDKFEQFGNEILNLSGCTQIFGQLHIESGATFLMLSNHGVGKILTSDANGIGTWQINTGSASITGATNGLGVTNKNICLGGDLNANTIINVGTNNLCLCSSTCPNREISLSNTNDSINLSWSDTANTCIGCVNINPLSVSILSQYAGGGCSANVLIEHADNRICLGSAGTYRTYHDEKGLWYVNDYSSGATDRWIPDKKYVDSVVSGGTGGGITGATNLGTGNGTLFTSISDNSLQFKSLSAGTNITLSCNANYVTINSTASGSGSGIGWSNLANGSTIAGCGTVASASTVNCNTAFGVCALDSITSSACSNVAMGYKTLQSLTTRCNNTAIGNYAGYSATGNSNVFIGHCAGYNETGSGKLYIATGATNPLIYGDFSNKYVQINGSIIQPYTSISSGATVNWDTYAGTNRTLTAGSNFTLSLSNLINGMQGDLRLNVTNILSITLPTSKLNGSVTDLTIGVYHLTWTYDGSNLEFSIAKYV